MQGLPLRAWETSAMFPRQADEHKRLVRSRAARGKCFASDRALSSACEGGPPTKTTTPRGNAVKLYSYFRSSAAYRVRIALNLKGIGYETVPIHLTKDGGRHKSAEYRAINPQMRVPALELAGGEVLVQSLAIIDYLDETFPQPPLLPPDARTRAQARAVAEIVACDIHPLNNLAPLNYLRDPLGHDQAAVRGWYHHWILEGFAAIEGMIKPGPYALGAAVTLADVCLVPQVANAQRFKVPLDRFPNIAAVEAACQQLPAFDKARPENQPDAE
jgi:maleylacetoacetate isomerase